MFPPLARIKGRGTAVRWLLEHAQGALASYTPTPADRVALAALTDASKSLRARARDKLGDHAPSFKDWTDLLESLRQTLPPEAAAPPPDATPAASPVPEDIFAEPPKQAAPAAAPPVAAPPPEPAKPADDPATLAAAWLAPIPGDKGSEAASSEEYQTVLAEVDKLQSPSGGTIDWARVVRDGDTVLQRQTKDIKIACHVALARYRTGKLRGLAVGLAIVAEVTDKFWDTMQPPVARVRGRVGALRGLLDLIEPELGTHTPTPDEGPALAALKQSITRLQAVTRARIADQAPNLRLLIQTVDQLIMTVKEAAKAAAPPPPAPVPEARPAAPVPEARPATPPPPAPTPSQPAAPAPAANIAAPAAVAGPGDATPAAVDKFLRGVGEEFVKLATALRRAKLSDPLAYRLLRTGLYVYITAPPPAPKDDTTAIPGLTDKDRARLDTMRSNNRWAELLEASESLLPTNRYNLDLHRYSHDALQQLGPDHAAAASALTAEVASLLTRLPRLLALKSKEGTPLAAPETRSWLDSAVLGGKGGGGGSPSSAPIILTTASAAPTEPSQLKKMLATPADRENGLRLAAAQIQQSTSGRDRFLRRLELAEACAAGKDAPLARQLLTGLVADIDALHLDTWEPALAARCFDALVRSIPKNLPAEKPALDAALARLASLDPFAATRP
jgi:type VI secretion system ImpA/VasJ family protein